jgi:hypothetical protein
MFKSSLAWAAWHSTRGTPFKEAFDPERYDRAANGVMADYLLERGNPGDAESAEFHAWLANDGPPVRRGRGGATWYFKLADLPADVLAELGRRRGVLWFGVRLTSTRLTGFHAPSNAIACLKEVWLAVRVDAREPVGS